MSEITQDYLLFKSMNSISILPQFKHYEMHLSQLTAHIPCSQATENCLAPLLFEKA